MFSAELTLFHLFCTLFLDSFDTCEYEPAQHTTYATCVFNATPIALTSFASKLFLLLQLLLLLLLVD